MKKISEGLYSYKGVEVRLESTGNYVAKVYVNDLRLPMTIVGATQKGFMANFNRLVKENGGLKLEK